MNKKIIAIAIATAMAAPVAMADMKITGAFGGDYVNTSKGFGAKSDATSASRAFEDNGASQINFMATSGSAYGKFGFNMGPGASANVLDNTGTAIGKSYNSPVYRDYFLGYNFSGGSSFQFGTMAGAVKNTEKDPLIATFLQTRNTYAEAVTSKEFGSSSFVNNLIQYKMKAGSANVTIQYDPTSNVSSSTHEGHVALAVTGKASGINYWVGYNNGQGGDKGTTGTGATVSQSNMKAGGSMKFGAVKATLNYTSADDATNKWNSVAVTGDMDLGNGMSVLATIATTGGDTAKKGDFSRVAVIKSIGPKARLYAGFSTNKKKSATAEDQFGLGMSVKF